MACSRENPSPATISAAEEAAADPEDHVMKGACEAPTVVKVAARAETVIGSMVETIESREGRDQVDDAQGGQDGRLVEL